MIDIIKDAPVLSIEARVLCEQIHRRAHGESGCNDCILIDIALSTAHAAGVAQERERAAEVARQSNFEDGSDGTIESQIAAAIRAQGKTT